MALHLITGRANAGKTGLVNARLAQALERGESPVLLVPTIADARRATAEVADKFPVGVRVATWDAWFEEAWRLHGDGRRLIDEPTRVALVARALSLTSTPVLGRVAHTRGFSALLSRLVSRVPIGVTGARGKGALQVEVLEICSRYAALVKSAGRIEATQAADVLSSNTIQGIAPIVLNRFVVLDASQVALVRGLSCNTDVTVALAWEDGFAPTTAVGWCIQNMETCVTTWDHVDEGQPRTEIDELVSILYSGCGPVAAMGQVRLGLAGGVEAEAELAARAVREAMDRGVAPDRIAVAFEELEPVSHRLRTALDSYEIPFEIDTVRPVSRSSLGAAFAAALDLALGLGDRTTALALLLGPHSDVPAGTVEELDRRWRTNRVAESRYILQDIVSLEHSETARALEEMASVAGRALTVNSADRLVHAINHLIAARASRAPIPQGDSAALAGRLADDASISRALFQAVSGMASVEGAPFTLAEVRLALPSVSAGGTMGERSGFVQVTEAGRLRSRRFDTLVIGGLTAGESPVGTSESLADEIEDLVGVIHGPDREELARLRFYLAASRARNELVLLRKEESSGGAPMRPSVLWEEVLDVYRGSEEDQAQWPEGGPEPMRLRSSEVAAVAPAFTTGRRMAREAVVAGSTPCLPTMRGQIADKQALIGLAALGTYSVSEIESYLQCPYRWFYDRVVRPKEIDAEIDARAIGSLAHDLLKEFYVRWADRMTEVRITPDNIDVAKEVFAQVSATAGHALRARGFADDLAIARGARWAAGIIEDDAIILDGFAPLGHEIAFGDAGSELVLGGVAFRGRIDRVDCSDRALFVTDYKSSRTVTGVAKFAEEGRIQAVVYAEASRRLFGDLPIAGSVYRSLRTLSMRGFWRADLAGGMLGHGDEGDAIGAAGYDALVAETEDRIADAIEGIQAGDIARRPLNKAACGFCPIANQCGGDSR